MSWDDEEQSGIPTRAIHESYLNTQRALRSFRRAKDRGSEAEKDAAHGELQDSVIGLYELLRPHLRHNNSVEDYWDGEPPNYHGNGTPPDPEDGKAVLHIQQKNEICDVRGINTEELGTLKDWHETLGLNGQTRIVGVANGGEMVPEGSALVTYQTYQLGLRNLDSWETKYQSSESDMGGFMGGRKTTERRRARIDVQRLKRASRELSDVAQLLGALSEFEGKTKHTKITNDQIQRLREWQEENHG